MRLILSLIPIYSTILINFKLSKLYMFLHLLCCRQLCSPGLLQQAVICLLIDEWPCLFFTIASCLSKLWILSCHSQTRNPSRLKSKFLSINDIHFHNVSSIYLSSSFPEYSTPSPLAPTLNSQVSGPARVSCLVS